MFSPLPTRAASLSTSRCTRRMARATACLSPASRGGGWFSGRRGHAAASTAATRFPSRVSVGMLNSASKRPRLSSLPLLIGLRRRERRPLRTDRTLGISASPTLTSLGCWRGGRRGGVAGRLCPRLPILQRTCGLCLDRRTLRRSTSWLTLLLTLSS
jgi:hypothetical protein